LAGLCDTSSYSHATAAAAAQTTATTAAATAAESTTATASRAIFNSFCIASSSSYTSSCFNQRQRQTCSSPTIISRGRREAAEKEKSFNELLLTAKQEEVVETAAVDLEAANINKAMGEAENFTAQLRKSMTIVQYNHLCGQNIAIPTFLTTSKYFSLMSFPIIFMYCLFIYSSTNDPCFSSV
jgi:hypothetical protein